MAEQQISFESAKRATAAAETEAKTKTRKSQRQEPMESGYLETLDPSTGSDPI